MATMRPLPARGRRTALSLRVAALSAALSIIATAFGAMAATPTTARVSPGYAPAGEVDANPFAGQVKLRLVTGGLSSPLFVTNAGDGTDRLFVVERGGRIRVVKNGTLQGGSFLDITSKVTAGGERGLLGLAFHPAFESNHLLYVYYTRASDGDIVVAEYTAASDNQSVSASTEDPLLVIDHSTYANHNGGMLAFGPDGELYIGTGDGGGSGDPFENAQNTSRLLGKILRIHPTGSGTYSIPSGNPYAAGPGADEVWDHGLRNPWRFSFDRATGTLWIADVGQNAWEEVNREAASTGGRNYGWDCREGKHWYETTGCDTSAPWPYVDPILEYSHSLGCSITGGYVYRGSIFDDLVGNYVYGDYCSGRLWSVTAAGSTPVSQGSASVNISSFGESEDGEIYLTDLNGRLYWVIAPPFTDITNSSFLMDIIWLEESGITKGCTPTTFCPNDDVTRGQMAAFLARALSLPTTDTDYFTDDAGSIYQNDINKLAAAGITKGCTATRFCPDDPVTRGQMAAFLVRALGLPPTGTDFFTDDESSTFEGDINRLAASGITKGCTPTTFCPDDDVTRGQMAAFLHRAFE
jgi:glucose/arabinose dehydrogenase